MSNKEIIQKESSTIPVVGGFINWWNSLVFRWKSFLASDSKQKMNTTKEFLLAKGLIIILIAIAIYTAIVQPKFVSFENIVNIITYTFGNIFIALGVAGIILLTGTDLSASRIAAFCTCIVVAMLQTRKAIFPNLPDLPFIVPLLISLVVGGIIGLVNGFFVAKFKLHSFIVTLSMQFAMISVILIFLNLNGNNNQGLASIGDSFRNLMNGGFTINGVKIKNIIFYGIVAMIIIWFLWNKTKFGKNMYAVGCNPEAATVSGISVFWTTVIVFTIAGVLYGLSGFISASWNGSANASTASNAELYAIAACVIGGVSFSGGVGKISGVVLGVFMIQMLQNALQFLQGVGIINSNIMSLVLGAVILAAVIIDVRKYLVKR